MWHLCQAIANEAAGKLVSEGGPDEFSELKGKVLQLCAAMGGKLGVAQIGRAHV